MDNIAPIGWGKSILNKFTGFSLKKRVIIGILVIPLVLWLLILIIEKLIKLVGIIWNGFWDILVHYGIKENRAIYTFTIFLFMGIGVLLQYNTNVVEVLIDIVNDIKSVFGGIF